MTLTLCFDFAEILQELTSLGLKTRFRLIWKQDLHREVGFGVSMMEIQDYHRTYYTCTDFKHYTSKVDFN